MSNNRFHVYIGKRRTTVSLAPTMASLIALKEGMTPGTPEAHSVVRKRLQEHIDSFPDTGRVNVSQWLKGEVLLSLVDKKLSERYSDWLLSEAD